MVSRRLPPSQICRDACLLSVPYGDVISWEFSACNTGLYPERPHCTSSCPSVLQAKLIFDLGRLRGLDRGVESDIEKVCGMLAGP
jgi:hypothetical protein